jgi:hypothetical protein
MLVLLLWVLLLLLLLLLLHLSLYHCVGVPLLHFLLLLVHAQLADQDGRLRYPSDCLLVLVQLLLLLLLHVLLHAVLAVLGRWTRSLVCRTDITVATTHQIITAVTLQCHQFCKIGLLQW